MPRYEIDMNNLKTIYGSAFGEKYSYKRNVCLQFSNLYGRIKPVKPACHRKAVRQGDGPHAGWDCGMIGGAGDEGNQRGPSEDL